MSRNELNKILGFPPNHDLTPEQIASYDPLLFKETKTGKKGWFGEPETNWVDPTKSYVSEDGPDQDFLKKGGAAQDAQREKHYKILKAAGQDDKIEEADDKYTAEVVQKAGLPAPTYITKRKKIQKKKDAKKNTKVDLSYGGLGKEKAKELGITGYGGGRATGGLVSRRKSKKKT
jgi:hypothetical protein